MRRQLNRAALLLATALATTGCASLGMDSADAPAKPAAGDAAQNTPQSPFQAELAKLPHDLDGEIRRAQLQRAQGDFKGAVKALSQLMLIAPDDPRIVGEYGKVLTQVGGRAGDAKAFLDRAIQLQPDNWTFYSALGVAYDQMGEPDKAGNAYKHALALKPENPTVLNNYAMSQMQAGHLDHAEKLLREAAAHGADYPKIANNLAMIAAMRGKSAPAGPESAIKPAAPHALASLKTPPTARRAATRPVEVKAFHTEPSGAPRALVAAKTADRTANAAARHTEPRVVMQKVPYDPLAGKHYSKTEKVHAVARATPSPKAQHLAQADTQAKPAKKQEPAIPPLRTAADIY